MTKTERPDEDEQRPTLRLADECSETAETVPDQDDSTFSETHPMCW